MKNVLLGGLLSAVACVPAHAWDLTALNKRADENLFQVGNGCSGTLVDIDARLILTAYHCIADAIAAQETPDLDMDGDPILGPDGQPRTKKSKDVKEVPVHQLFWDDKGEKSIVSYPAKIVARDALKDVAILQIPLKVGPVALAIRQGHRTAARLDGLAHRQPEDVLRHRDEGRHVGLALAG